MRIASSVASSHSTIMPRSGAVVRLNAVGDCGHDRALTICLTSSAAAGGRRRRAALFFAGAAQKPITSHGLGL
jgi:hypothetical protein